MQVSWPERDTIIYQEYKSGKFRSWNLTNSVYGKNPGFKDMHPFEKLTQPTNYINQLIDFNKLQNICKKIGVKLMLWSFDDAPGVLLPYLVKEDNYYHFTNRRYTSSTKSMLDYGTDNMHPGPLQHQAYADFVLEKLTLVDDRK